MLKLKRGDVLLMAFLVLVGSVWLLLRAAAENRQTFDPSALDAVITVDGKPYATVPLDGPEQTVDIRTEYGHNTLKVFNQGIQMVYADCPKKFPCRWVSSPARAKRSYAFPTGCTWRS